MQRSTSFSLNHSRRRLRSSITESESEGEEIKLDASSYQSNDKLTLPREAALPDTISVQSSDSDSISMYRSQSDVSGVNQGLAGATSITGVAGIAGSGVAGASGEDASMAMETEYSEYDPELAESFRSLRDFERNYGDKLDLLMNFNQPIDPTAHEQAYQYQSYNLDTPFTRKTIHTTAPPELGDDDMPATITETVVQSVHAFLNTPSQITSEIQQYMKKCIESAKARAQAFTDSIEILEELHFSSQASRLYLLGVQSALISTPNAATYRSCLSQFSPFINSLDEIQMADFMANIHGVDPKYIKRINESILQFCQYLMSLFKRCMSKMSWRLGTTVLWILSSDFNNTLIYDPFFLGLPAFYRNMLDQLSGMIGQDVLITAGPYWDANCTRLPVNENVVRGKDGSPFLNSQGLVNEKSVFCNSACSTPLAEAEPRRELSPPPSARPATGMSAFSSLRSTVKSSLIRSNSASPAPLSSSASSVSVPASPSHRDLRDARDARDAREKVCGDPTYGCFSTAVFAMANSLRICYGLLLIRQFYDHQLKLKQNRPQHMNTRNWSLDDVFMVFGYDSPRYFQCTRGMFDEFMGYFSSLMDRFERRCRAWRPSGLSGGPDHKRTRHGCFRSYEGTAPAEESATGATSSASSASSANSSTTNPANATCTTCTTNTTGKQQEAICPERSDLLVSSGESLLAYYLSLIVWVLNTYIGGMIEWQIYGDLIWKFMYASPRLRKLAVICMQSIVPYTDFLPSMLNDANLYRFVFSQKEVEKLPSSVASAIARHRSMSSVFNEDDDDESSDNEEEDNAIRFRNVDPEQMSQEEKEQAFVYYLLHLCVHDDFCFGAMTEERLACAQCCPFFAYIYQRLSTEIVEEEEGGTTNRKRRLMFPTPPSLQPKNMKTSCKMLIRPEGYGASNCNLVVAEEVVYLLRNMLQSDRWKTLILDIFEVILENTVEQIIIEKENMQKFAKAEVPPRRSENKERERIVWYSMGSAVLKVMGSISRRLYSGCRVRVRQEFMDHITDLDVLIQTIHQSSGTGYVIDYDINSGNVLVLLDQMQVPKTFTIYTLDVVDKVPIPSDLSDETRDFLITYVQKVIINLEYPDELFELGQTEKVEDTPFQLVELQNLVLEQNAIYVFHQLIISFPKCVKLLTREFITVMLSLALKPSPAKGIFGTEFVRYCFNHLAELLIDTYPNCPKLYQAPAPAAPPQRAMSPCVDPAVYGQEKARESTIEIYQPMDAPRLALAREVQEYVGQPLAVIYKALKLFRDDKMRAADYLLENAVETEASGEDVEPHVDLAVHLSDKAAIYDFDGPRSSPLFSGQSVRSTREKKTQIMHSVPFFAQFEPATPQNLKYAQNVIASRCEQKPTDAVYPVKPTGVICAVEGSNVVLSMLDTNSGISKRVSYPYYEIMYHRRRFGNAFSSMSALRRMTARICLNLDLRLLRELIITLLYLFQKQGIDVFSCYGVKPEDLVHFAKLIHVFSSTITSKSFIPGMNHITPTSALTFILKQTLMMMVKAEPQPLLLNAVMANCWTESPFGSLIVPLGSRKYYVSSLHPYFRSCKYYDKVIVPKAQALRVVFDDRCMLLKDHAFLTFYRDSSYTHRIACFNGPFANFSTLHIQGNALYYSFEANQEVSQCWGFGFCVEPLTGLSWNNDIQVQGPGCFDWVNWELGLVLDIGEEVAIARPEYFNQVVKTIMQYLCTYGAPYKSRAVELLLRLLSQPQYYAVTELPDIAGIRQSVYRCAARQRTKVLPEVRLMLEMCISFELYGEMVALKTPDDAAVPLPPFEPSPPAIDDSQALRDVHRLARNLCYGSLPSACYLKFVVEHTGDAWSEASYRSLADAMRRFTRQQDISLMELFYQKCTAQKLAPNKFDINSFFLTQEDLIRNSNLEAFSGSELRQRLTLIRLLNRQLGQVIQFIDLMDTAQENRLGTILCSMSEYIDPSIKESVLELSIKETQFDLKESRPVIVLDSMRTYEDPDESTQRAPILFNESVTKNAFTSQCTFAQMFREVMKIDVAILRSPLDARDRLFAVKYKGEQGLDFGGLYRDTIERW